MHLKNIRRNIASARVYYFIRRLLCVTSRDFTQVHCAVGWYAVCPCGWSVCREASEYVFGVFDQFSMFRVVAARLRCLVQRDCYQRACVQATAGARSVIRGSYDGIQTLPAPGGSPCHFPSFLGGGHLPVCMQLCVKLHLRHKQTIKLTKRHVRLFVLS